MDAIRNSEMSYTGDLVSATTNYEALIIVMLGAAPFLLMIIAMIYAGIRQSKTPIQQVNIN